MQIICMYAVNSHALLSFKFNYSNISIRSLLYNIIQTNRPTHFCRIVLNTFSYFNKSEVVMIYERWGEWSLSLGFWTFAVTLIVFVTSDTLHMWYISHVKSASCPFWNNEPGKFWCRYINPKHAKTWLNCLVYTYETCILFSYFTMSILW